MKVKMFKKEWEVNNPTYKEKRELHKARMSTIDSGGNIDTCLLYTSPSPRDRQKSRMPSSA